LSGLTLIQKSIVILSPSLACAVVVRRVFVRDLNATRM